MPNRDSADAPRYTSTALPAYRYLPGRAPHPRRDADGHSYGRAEPSVAPWHAADWARLEPWLRAVDLFNASYWWEAHEQLEALWKAAGKHGHEARFVRAVLRIASAALHRELGREASCAKQAHAALTVLDQTMRESSARRYMGIDVAGWSHRLRRWLEEGSARVPAILLDHHDA